MVVGHVESQAPGDQVAQPGIVTADLDRHFSIQLREPESGVDEVAHRRLGTA